MKKYHHINGTKADEFIFGTNAADQIYTGAVAKGRHHGDVIYGLSGDDLIYDANPIADVVGVANDVIRGGAGNDTIISYAGHDIIFGGSGNDSFELLHLGKAEISGGKGEDTLHILIGDPDDWTISKVGHGVTVISYEHGDAEAQFITTGIEHVVFDQAHIA